MHYFVVLQFCKQDVFNGHSNLTTMVLYNLVDASTVSSNVNNSTSLNSQSMNIYFPQNCVDSNVFSSRP